MFPGLGLEVLVPLLQNDSSFSDGVVVMSAFEAICQFILVLFLVPEIYLLTLTSIALSFKAQYLCSKQGELSMSFHTRPSSLFQPPS